MKQVKSQLKDLYFEREWNKEEITEKMTETYCLQREQINDGCTVDECVKEWPFLGESFGLLQHFEQLVGIKLEIAIRQGFESKGLRLQRYFKS